MSMQRRAPADFSDYWEIFLRRRWWFLGTALLASSVVFGVSMKLTRIYRSETLILVEPQKVPQDFVKSTISGDVTDRLQTISQEILSRTRLQHIIDQFGLYQEQAKKNSREEIVELMRRDITVEIVADSRVREHAVGGFRISYMGRDPQLVQQVTREIASLFIEENLKVREQQAEGTNEFLEDELKKAREHLQEQEEKIRKFKAEHMGSLPEQEQSNLSVMAQMQAMLQSNGDALARAQQQETYLKSLLEAMQKTRPVAAKSALELDLDSKRTELVAAEQKYKPTHPDVIRLRSEVKALETRVAETRKTEGASGTDSPDQINSQLAGLETEIKGRNARQTEIEGKIRALQGRVEVLPMVEQQFAEINRDYLISKADYESLLQKKNASAMSAEMERRAKGEQFRILDPASFPEKPYKPDLLQLNLLGVLGGLMLGGILGLVMESRDRSLHSERDLAYALSLPVLATMPRVRTAAQLKESSKDKSKYTVAACLLLPLLIAGALWLVR